MAAPRRKTFVDPLGDAHRAQLMERLDLHDVAGLVRFAVKVGLVTPEVRLGRIWQRVHTR